MNALFHTFILTLRALYFLVADTQLYKRLFSSVGRSVGWSVTLELKSGKTHISAPAHPSATGGRVSSLVTFPEALQVQQIDKNKAGYTATPVVFVWAGAIIEVTSSFGLEQ